MVAEIERFRNFRRDVRNINIEVKAVRLLEKIEKCEECLCILGCKS